MSTKESKLTYRGMANMPNRNAATSHGNVAQWIGELAKGIGSQKKIRSMQEVLDNLIVTKEEREQLAFSLRYLDADQRQALLQTAWEVGSAQYMAELAEDSSLLILASAIDRTLRSEEALESHKNVPLCATSVSVSQEAGPKSSSFQNTLCGNSLRLQPK